MGSDLYEAKGVKCWRSNKERTEITFYDIGFDKLSYYTGSLLQHHHLNNKSLNLGITLSSHWFQSIICPKYRTKLFFVVCIILKLLSFKYTGPQYFKVHSILWGFIFFNLLQIFSTIRKLASIVSNCHGEVLEA